MSSRQTEAELGCRRRSTLTVNVRGVKIGSAHPVALQSMTDTSTMDTPGSVDQCIALADAGAALVRLTTQGVREADNLANIRAGLDERGYEALPLVADIHFNPRAAMAAALTADKVRINPGNFVDPGRTFVKLNYTDEEYAEEIKKIDDALRPLLKSLASRGGALRIGVNHGSLSDRIMSRYGDTPAGIVESAMEFLRACHRQGFDNIVVSVKASNVVVMVESVRRLARAMDAEGMNYPLHLGVTEAGDAEDGRIKSAVGIGTLLSEGLGDTIRVSLSESPVHELPVARRIADYVHTLESAPMVGTQLPEGYDPVMPGRRMSNCVEAIVYPDSDGHVVAVGGGKVPVVVGTDPEAAYQECRRPDIFAGHVENIVEIDASVMLNESPEIDPNMIVMLTSGHANRGAEISAAVLAMMSRGIKNPVISMLDLRGLDAEDVVVRASVDLGRLALNGLIDGVMIKSDTMSATEVANLSFGILQAARLRTTATEYISCPGCGRTMFDLPDTLRRVKEATGGLRGMKIGVMGCVVNGPGEMADADYGYVGAAAGCVSLYRGKECVARNIPEAEAPQRLVELIKADGNWK